MTARPRLPVLAAISLVLAAWLWLYWDGSARRASVAAGAEAVAATRDSIPAILSYQPATAGTDLPAAARERLTGPFLADYTQLITTVVVPDAKQNGISSTATVPAAAVVSANADHAVILAYVNQTMTVGAAAPTRANTSMRVAMDKVDGRWLISGFDEI